MSLPKETMEILEALAPELAESEDERIRKIITDSVFYQYGAGVEYKDVLDYLDKLEKQKENPKSADSISSDCISDAKCEDRWHKVTDSLPDNGREVLAKDKLGNTLLARYDGEGWDVSVYDDEDYRCHNGISKWCEIPSEKQKETLHIPETCKENANSFTDEDERVRRWLCDYFSSIDKAWIHKDITCIDILRWLEKQKEQKKEKFPPYVTGFKGHPDPAGTSDLEEAAEKYIQGSMCDLDDGPTVGLAKEAFIAGAEWQKEQKPAEWSEEDEDNLCRVIRVLEDNDSDWKELSNWLKPLRPQPKQEWSQEDEKDMAHIIRILNDCYVYAKHDLSKTDHENLVNKLKSLRPSWKPNEEQMNALLNAEGFLRAGLQHDSAKTIAELYEQLKAL